MVKLHLDEFTEETTWLAGKLLDRPPVSVSEDYGSYQFKEIWTGRTFGGVRILLTEGHLGDNEDGLAEAYRSDVELTYDRWNNLISARGREYLESGPSTNLQEGFFAKTLQGAFLWLKDSFIPSKREAKKAELQNKIGRFATRALEASER